jgi:hypothetical protein
MSSLAHALESQEMPAHSDQLVDAHLKHAYFINPHKDRVKHISSGHCFADKRFVIHCYQVGPYSNVFCLWPKNWKEPGPNKNGWLPKFEFAKDPAANDPRDQYDHDIIFAYTDIDGKDYTPPVPFNPKEAPQEKKE